MAPLSIQYLHANYYDSIERSWIKSDLIDNNNIYCNSGKFKSFANKHEGLLHR